VFDAYWRFAVERQAIFFRRLQGESPPWTADPIFQRYRFCNAYRASDRVTQFLIREVIYQPELTTQDLLLRIVLFRLFSRPQTWQALEAAHGGIRASSFDPARFSATLDGQLAAGEPVYTSAFILPAASEFGHARKHANHLALVEHMLRTGLPRAVASSRSLEQVYRALLEYPSIGPFLAYQIAIDLNYSELIDFDEDDFTAPGPGALRGIAKCFESTAGWSDARIIHWMVDRQEEEFARLGLQFQSLWGRLLHAIDCQNLFCEVDKYARAAFPELSSNRTRIKRTFTPDPAPLELFYPPKWGINARISAHRSDRTGQAG
jgi:hypothetical protein